MSKNIRVSDAAYQELQTRASVEGRTVVAIVDRLLRTGGAVEKPKKGSK